MVLGTPNILALVNFHDRLAPNYLSCKLTGHLKGIFRIALQAKVIEYEFHMNMHCIIEST